MTTQQQRIERIARTWFNDEKEGRERCISALTSFAEEEEKWQPIETAPKDGTQILAWYPGLRSTPVQTWWLPGANRWHLTGNPTHWQPLPPAPRSLNDDETSGGHVC